MTHVKHLDQCLALSKNSINVSYHVETSQHHQSLRGAVEVFKEQTGLDLEGVSKEPH